MVLQVLADPGQLVPHGHPGGGERRAGADAGELENLRRADGAGGQDHLAPGRDRGDTASALAADAGGAPPVQLDAVHEGARDDAEIAA